MFRKPSLVPGGGGGGEKDESEEAHVIKIGDYVSLFDTTHHGYLFSHLSGSHYTSLAVKPARGKEDPGLGDFKTAVFQILPNNSFRAGRTYQNFLAKKKRESPELTEEQILADAGEEGMHLKRMAETEDADNKLEQKRKKGDPVVYGQLILLYHPHSNKYLSLSTASSNSKEASIKASMDGTISPQCWMKIMPRYKVRAEGDFVRFTDQVLLESAKSTGQFLHSNSTALNSDSINAGCYEINFSVAGSSLIVYCHMQPREDDDKYLKGGDIIQLFHKETSGYIAAEGVMTKQQVVENVHVRVREPDPKRPSRQFPPTSAVSFWQVEIDGAPQRGSRVRWETAVYLKHVPTQWYLAYYPGEGDGVGHFALTKHPSVDEGVFYFYPVVKEEKYIRFGAFSRIEHGGQWLHVLKNIPYVRRDVALAQLRGQGELGDRISAMKWDHAPLLLLGLSEQQMFDDAYSINPVPSDHVLDVNFAMGMAPVLDYIEARFLTGKVGEIETLRHTQTITELTSFMYKKGSPSKKCQKLLRNIYLVDSLVKLLQAPFKPYNSSGLEFADLSDFKKNYMRDFLLAIYHAIEIFVEGDSRKNELYIAKYIPFFQTHVGHSLGVEKMYTELVRDNDTIIDLLSDDEIKLFIGLLQREKNPEYLNFLSVLCSCDGVANLANQLKVTKALLDNPAGPLVYLTELNPEKTDVLVSMDNGATWGSLRAFATQEMGSKRHSTQYLFLEAQLNIFGQLCNGRCAFAIEIITNKLRYLTFDECFHCARDPKLPKSLRTTYVGLMKSLFVDVGENADVLAEVHLGYDWSKISASPNADALEDRTLSLGGCVMTFFPVLSSWIIEYLSSVPYLLASDKEGNRLLESILELLSYLVDFGYYAHPDDVKLLMVHLTNILNGFDDKPAETKSKTNEPRLLNMSAKGLDHGSSAKEANDDAAASGREPSNAFVREWRKKGRYEKNSQNKTIMRAKEQALAIVDSLFNYVTTFRLHLLIHTFKQLREGNQNLSHEQVEVLSQLATTNEVHDYDQADRNVVLSLFATLFERTNWLAPTWLATTNQRRFGEPTMIEILLDLAKYDYRSLVVGSLRLVDRFYTAHEDLIKLAIPAQVFIVPESIALNEYLSKKLATVRRLGSGEIDEEEMKAYFKIIDKLTKQCYLADEKTPHSTNQTIIYNTGIMHVIYDIISYPGQPPDVLEHSFRFVRAMCVQNPSVQKEVFDLLDDFLNCKGSSGGWENSLAQPLIEVFSNCKEIVIAAKPHHIEKMVALLAKHTTAAPDFAEALRALIKVEEFNVALRRNQDAVLRAIMQHRVELLGPAMLDDCTDAEENAKRIALLRDAPSDDPVLKYHLSVVLLLSSTAEGENKFTESICQSIMSVDMILQVLRSVDIPLVRKSPYMQYLLWVFLNTETPPIESSAQYLSKSPDFWNAIATLFMGSQFAELSARSETLTHEETSVIYDGLFPLLTRVMAAFYDPVRYPPAFTALSNITSFVCKFAVRVAEGLFVHTHIKSVAALLSLLTTICPQYVDTSALDLLGSKILLKDSGLLMSPIIAEYQTKYKEQIELNVLFNSWVSNLLLMYQGENVVGVQLQRYISPSLRKKKASLLRNEYSSTENEDMALPLGTEFQGLVSLFVRFDEGEFQSLNLANFRILVTLISASNRYGASLSAGKRKKLDRVVVKVLQVVRAIVHNAMALEIEYSQLQDEIAKEKTILHVSALLSNPNDMVVKEALSCLIVLLEEGNKAAQDSFVEHFLLTREETFFHDCQFRLRKSAEDIRQTLLLQAQVAEVVLSDQGLTNTLVLAGHLERSLDMASAQKTSPTRSSTSSSLTQTIDPALPPTVASLPSPDSDGLTVLTPIPEHEAAHGFKSTDIPLTDISHMSSTELLPHASSSTSVPERAPLARRASASGAVKKKIISFKDPTSRSVSTDTPVALRGQASAVVEVRIKDSYNVKLLLRLLQLMCEGHHSFLQNYLRVQHDNIRSVDIVAETVSFMQVLSDNICPETIAIMTQTLETLIELAQGCESNQVAIFNARIVDYLNQALRIPSYKDCSEDESGKLRMACAKVVLSMLEDSSDTTANLAKELEETLDLPAILSQITSHYALFRAMSHHDRNTSSTEDWLNPVDIGFAFLNIVLRLHDFTGTNHRAALEADMAAARSRAAAEDYAKSNSQKDDASDDRKIKHVEEEEALVESVIEDEEKDGYTALMKMTSTIEIIRFGRIQKIHFLNRWGKLIREEVKDEMKWNVDRSSPADKIRDFVDRSRVIIADIAYLKQVRGKSRLLGKLIDHTQLWNSGLLFLTFLLNACIIAGFKAPQPFDERVKSRYPHYDDWFFYVLYIGGAFHVLFSVLVALSFFLVRPPSIHATFESIPYFGEYLLSLLPESTSLRSRTSLFSVMALYYLGLVGFSIAALFFSGYFFCFHLFHIVINNDILIRVIQSVTRNGSSLLWVAALMLVVIYIYSLAAFAFLRNTITPDTDLYCSTEWECFLTALRNGLLYGGGLGEALAIPELDKGSVHIAQLRILFDLTFFIIILIIGLNVVFGIIVDTFSELRDEKYSINESMHNECFICSLQGYEFEKFGNGFAYHVKKEHHMWDYVCFMLHLHEKPPSEYTAHEAYFDEMLETNQESQVFPLNRASSLTRSLNTGVEERLDSLEKKLDDLTSFIYEEFSKAEEQKQQQSHKSKRRVGFSPDGRGSAGPNDDEGETYVDALSDFARRTSTLSMLHSSSNA